METNVAVPLPPNDQEKFTYVEQNKLTIYFAGILSFLSLITGMVLFILNHYVFFVYVLFVALLIFYLGLSYFIGIFGASFNLKQHEKVLAVAITEYPTIDVYLPSCGEDPSIIANTLKHVSFLDYPSDKLKVYVLDDCKKEDHQVWLKDLSHQYGYTYISRSNKGELKKAGNIRNAFAISNGEYELILDADFVPRPDMLKTMVPYMIQDPKIAIVQTPQYFSIKNEQTPIEKGAAYIQELFYRLIQVNRGAWNASICVGTCALYRRSALEPHGGTAPIGYSEDVHTGFQAICDGYKIKYLPINLSKGVCPDSTMAFLVQQYRWATGSVTLFCNKHFWFSGLPLMTKMNYLSGMLYYITTAIGLFLVPLPGLAMLLFYPSQIFYYNLIFSLPSLINGTLILGLWSRAKWGYYTMEVRQLSYWSHFFAIVDKVKNTTIAWIPTGEKDMAGSTKGISTRFFQWYTRWNGALLLTTLGLIIWRMATMVAYYHFIPALIFWCFNAYLFIRSYKDFRKYQ
jgi:cellulose synthase/poly-beta-1,6-N-acetylglucosamine synthase-like glycosyltransferase